MPYFVSAAESFILRREQEDKLLGNCNGSCSAGPAECRCVVDLGSSLSGQRVEGLDLCVLCLRWRVAKQAWVPSQSSAEIFINPYINYHNEYHSNFVYQVAQPHLTGCFVRYSASDYDLVGPCSISQARIPFNCTIPAWLSHLFEVYQHNDLPPKVLKEIKSSIETNSWVVCICVSQQCGGFRLLSFKDHSREVGIGNATINPIEKKVVCSDCESPVHYLSPNKRTNVVDLTSYGAGFITRCIYCTSLTEFKPSQTIQVCKNCSVELMEQYEISKRVCHYCQAPISLTKRSCNGFQTYHVSEKGNTEDLYLCKKHKVKVRNTALKPKVLLIHK